jgi:hypothetical protein
MENKKYLKERVDLLEKEVLSLKNELKGKKTKKPKKLKLSAWIPKTDEDNLLNNYWTKIGGKLLVEVPVGGNHPDLPWDHHCTTRRLDGVIIKGDDLGKYKCSHNIEGLKNLFKGKRVEIIEVKKSINRTAIGQVVAGKTMFKQQYGIKNVKGVIVCGSGDSALEWVCKQHGIKVVKN